ncbi:hypothetical protein EWM64_g6515 [Hericium alpestre]|uniref:Tyr recombinase domain-containing protein n=1 Tax=Hericium alpestre TaxID=135208 RepID=A0A4Y9ZVJ2_9AGAM|nr:hypothetical protein EWM64_g6515 [Hericium alpestre]
MEHLLRERAIALGSAIDPSSHVTYNSHLQSYLTFCKIHSFAIDPTPDTLSFYVVFMCHHIQPRSVGQYLSGIANQLEHLFPDVRANRNSALVSRTLTGCTKRLGSAIRRKEPLAIDNLQGFLQATPQPMHDDLLFLAILACGFFGLHRLGELTWPDRVQARDWRKVIMRSSVRLDDSTFRYSLPAHKADRFFEGSTIIIAQREGAVDPRSIFTRYLASRDHQFPISPVLWLKLDGNVPSRSWFLSRLHARLSQSFGGHSLRSGGATYFAMQGWPDDRIQALGRWTSEAFRMYIRKNPVILQALLHARTAST